MGSNGGGYIVTSLGPVTVVPSKPFEWKGVNKINVGETGFKNLEPVMVVSGCRIYGHGGESNFFDLYLQGTNLTKEEFIGQTLNIDTDNGSTIVGTMVFGDTESDGSHVYHVYFTLEVSELNDMTSFSFSPPDKAFEITCVDLMKG